MTIKYIEITHKIISSVFAGNVIKLIEPSAGKQIKVLKIEYGKIFYEEIDEVLK